jgi:hypothetical protein
MRQQPIGDILILFLGQIQSVQLEDNIVALANDWLLWDSIRHLSCLYILLHYLVILSVLGDFKPFFSAVSSFY